MKLDEAMEIARKQHLDALRMAKLNLLTEMSGMQDKLSPSMIVSSASLIFTRAAKIYDIANGINDALSDEL